MFGIGKFIGGMKNRVLGVGKKLGGLKEGIGKINQYVSQAEQIGQTISSVPVVGQYASKITGHKGLQGAYGKFKKGQDLMNKGAGYIPG